MWHFRSHVAPLPLGLVLLTGSVLFASCDGAEGENGFGDAGPGVFVGEAKTFAWSADSERLYFTQDEDIVGDGGVFTGNRYEILESAPGGATRSLYQGVTSDYAPRAAIGDLKEAGGALFFFTDARGFPEHAGVIYRLPLGGSSTPEAVVEGATYHLQDSGESFAVSGDGLRLAYYARADDPNVLEVRFRDFSTGSEDVVATGTPQSFASVHHLPLILSEDGSRLLHQLHADQSSGEPDAYSMVTLYYLVDLDTGTTQRVQLDSPTEIIDGVRFYEDKGGFVAVYSAFSTSEEQHALMVRPLPDGAPETRATFSHIDGGWLAQIVLADGAAPGRYAFWRRELEGALENQRCALHVVDLDTGREQRVAGPMMPPPRGGACGSALNFAPGGTQIAYTQRLGGELHVAEVQR